MPSQNILDAYTNLDIKSYLDATLHTNELSYLKNELHKHEKLEAEINSKLFKTFMLNIDHLVDILEKNHEINRYVANIKEDINDYKTMFSYLQEKESSVYIDEEKQREFFNILRSFDSDTKMFASKKRYLVHSEEFSMVEANQADEKIDKCLWILIFTNDLLIIGKKTGENYILKNAFNYNVMKIKGHDRILRILVDPIELIFEKDAKSVNKILSIFKELRYTETQQPEKKEEEENENYDDEIFEFYIKTEQYEKLKEFKGYNKVKFNISDTNGSLETLFIFLTILEDDKKEPFINDYLKNIFYTKINNINIIQKLDNLIQDFFSIIQEMFFEAKEIYERYWKQFGIEKVKRGTFILFVESIILVIFETIKKRLFGKHGSIEETEKYLKKLGCKLKIYENDFSYLLYFFEDEMQKQNNALLYEDKQKINKILDDMLIQDKSNI
ncbi:hypothetical protein COBT_002022 [Conglomerata obtusa]